MVTKIKLLDKSPVSQITLIMVRAVDLGAVATVRN